MQPAYNGVESGERDVRLGGQKDRPPGDCVEDIRIYAYQQR